MRKRLVSIFLISLIAFFAFAQSNRETSGKTYTFKVSITQSSTDRTVNLEQSMMFVNRLLVEQRSLHMQVLMPILQLHPTWQS